MEPSRVDAAAREPLGGLPQRLDQVFRPWAGSVYPAEVEAVLNAHPAVMQSAVIGRAADANEEVVAHVQLQPGARATVDDLTRHAARELTAYKRPSEIVIREALPTSSAGKILKHRLSA